MIDFRTGIKEEEEKRKGIHIKRRTYYILGIPVYSKEDREEDTNEV